MENYKPQTRNDIVLGCLSNLVRDYDAIGASEVFFEYESALGKLLMEAYGLKIVTRYKYGFKGFNQTFVALLDIPFEQKHFESGGGEVKRKIPNPFPVGSWVKCKNNDAIRYVTAHSNIRCFKDDGTISNLPSSDSCYYDNYELFIPI